MHSLKDIELLKNNLKLEKSKNIITSAHIQGTARMGTPLCQDTCRHQ
jgi:hypothetical protein